VSCLDVAKALLRRLACNAQNHPDRAPTFAVGTGFGHRAAQVVGRDVGGIGGLANVSEIAAVTRLDSGIGGVELVESLFSSGGLVGLGCHGHHLTGSHSSLAAAGRRG
jgi:hypothetical protein